ncbi:ATP synthase membrane subunit K, mitochondrial [Leptidea sinapis]|uniref:Up-regulated during skeletal muscle growth protein 5 n=1 Tax=Leptidea sinapis TaxID=189913 RepID=A0A5E4QX63_9NEOP|nr:ATP synthase membrane subunit K, mitochondrial [Leptidea sinapis]VVD02236.1 unnamed protein product [Leptidea sinapis]
MNYGQSLPPAALPTLPSMAGEAVDESQLKGLSKYFNSQTNRGRANTAKATYAFFGVVILYNILKPKKSTAAK